MEVHDFYFSTNFSENIGMGDLNNAAPEMDESHEGTSRSPQSVEEGSLNKAIFSINENMAKMAAILRTCATLRATGQETKG